MACLACARWGGGPLCRSCVASLTPAPDRRLPTGLLVRSGLLHRGAARLLVRRLKYEGMAAAAGPLALAMAGRLPAGARALVPVPRVRLRRWRYGVDAAGELAAALAAEAGLPVVRLLEAPWWTPRQAGRSSRHRRPGRFRARLPAPEGAVLVDDVVTTGATLGGAHHALGGGYGLCALVATSRGRVGIGQAREGPRSKTERP